jgi:hypothetical protein
VVRFFAWDFFCVVHPFILPAGAALFDQVVDSKHD